jgi:hypothetical protein
VHRKKFVFQRLSFNNSNGNSNDSGTLVPRQSVFDRLEFDVSHAGSVKNKGFKDGQTSDRRFSDFNSIHSNAQNYRPSGDSNFKKDQVNNRFCIRCLRPGHWRSSCRSPVTCHKCLQPGHFASSCWSARLASSPSIPLLIASQAKISPEGNSLISLAGSKERNRLG